MARYQLGLMLAQHLSVSGMAWSARQLLLLALLSLEAIEHLEEDEASSEVPALLEGEESLILEYRSVLEKEAWRPLEAVVLRSSDCAELQASVRELRLGQLAASDPRFARQVHDLLDELSSGRLGPVDQRAVLHGNQDRCEPVAACVPSAEGLPASEPFVPTEYQDRMLDALDCVALHTDALAAAVGCNRRTLFKARGVGELKKRRFVSLHSVLGYYRPDAPPAEYSDELDALGPDRDPGN